MNVVEMDNEEELWDEYVNRSPQGTIFHTTAWRRAICRTFGYHSVYLYVVDKGQVCGCLPVFRVKNFVTGDALISVPFGTNGGICADNPAAVKVLLDYGKHLAELWQVDYLELRQRETIDADLPTKDLYVNFEREIFPDLDRNMEAIPRKQRRMVRQGIKNGLTSTMGGIEVLPSFYEIYSHSVRNLGTPVFSYTHFVHLCEEFGEKVRILSVWHENRVAAAVMTFFYKGRVFPYYGGSLKDYMKHSVNDFMYWELMKYGCEKGYGTFDFGRSKQGTGSYEFKRHWGFDPKPLPYQFYLLNGQQLPDVNPLNPKFRLMIQVWRRLPVLITKVLGPMLVRLVP